MRHVLLLIFSYHISNKIMLNIMTNNQNFTVNLMIAFSNFIQSNRWISVCGNLNFAIIQLYFYKTLDKLLAKLQFLGLSN